MLHAEHLGCLHKVVACTDYIDSGRLLARLITDGRTAARGELIGGAAWAAADTDGRL
jgi:hypothetical protein